MHSLDAHFNILLQRLEPDPDRAKKAKEQPGKLRDYLKKADTLSTVTPHTRLAGSYPRATAIRNIKDVDILVFVSRDYWGSIEELLTKLESTLRGYPKALDDVGEVKLRRQRRSVNVQLEGHDLSLDVVPALLPEEGSTTGILEIPDREWLRWVKSCPLGYSDLLSQLNQQHGGKAVPLTKMFKHWRTEKIKRAKVKSYWLESIVYDYLYHGWVSTERKGYAEIWADLFEAVYDRFLKVQEAEEEQCPFIPDGCLGNHVAFNWQRSHFNTFMNRLKESKGWARAAVDAEEAEQAVQLWQNVFGPDWFPSLEEVEQVKKAAEAYGTAAKSGLLHVASTGHVLAEPRPGVRSVPAPATRFFGGTR